MLTQMTDCTAYTSLRLRGYIAM